MSYLLTDAQKSIYNLIAAGGAFKNPHRDNLNALKSACDSAADSVDGMIFLSIGQRNAITIALIDLKTAANEVLIHTNRVSGVTRYNSSDVPDVQQIMSVSRARQTLKSQFGMTEQQSLASGMELFQSIYVNANSITSITAFVSSIANRLLGSEVSPGSQVTIILQKLNQHTSFLNNIPPVTDAAYNTALSELRIASMMYELSTFITPPTTTETVVQQEIGTPTLIDLIEQQKDTPLDN